MEQQNQVEFSIIVPIYKVEAYLHQCINSILGQTYANFELILVDDGSPDNCGKICDEYAKKDSRIKVFHQDNKGVCIARKVGVQKAKGDYVCWVDGDDYIGCNLLQQMHSIIAKYNPDMVAFGFTEVDDNGIVTKTTTNHIAADKFYLTNDAGFYEKLLSIPDARHFNYGAFIPGLCLKVCKREIIVPAMLLVPNEISLGEDLATTNQALCGCNTVYVSSICEYYYRFNASSLTHTLRLGMFYQWQALFEFINSHMDKIPQANKDAYICMEIANYIDAVIKKFDSYDDLMHYIGTEMSPELNEIVKHCKIPKLSLKGRIKFEILKHHWYWILWLKYHKVGNKSSTN